MNHAPLGDAWPGMLDGLPRRLRRSWEGTELLEDAQFVDQPPPLGHPAVGDAPDLNPGPGCVAAGRWERTQWCFQNPLMCTADHLADHHLVSLSDPVFDGDGPVG